MSQDLSDKLTSPEDIAALKAASSRTHGTSWRGDLWANVPAALQWANSSPVSQPGTIIFNIRVNGQVWTYTFV
jgi:hypothetical protein